RVVVVLAGAGGGAFVIAFGVGGLRLRGLRRPLARGPGRWVGAGPVETTGPRRLQRRLRSRGRERLGVRGGSGGRAVPLRRQDRPPHLGLPVLFVHPAELPAGRGGVRVRGPRRWDHRGGFGTDRASSVENDSRTGTDRPAGAGWRPLARLDATGAARGEGRDARVPA